MHSNIENLPGTEIIKKGLNDLERNDETIESLLVSIASPRLIRLGFKITNPYSDAERKLYHKLELLNPNNAHSQYNALIRRIISFSRAYESSNLAGNV